MCKFYFYSSVSGFRSKNVKSNHQNNKIGNSRIIDGEDEDIETFPYMAHLEMDNGKKVTHCGGTIVSNYSIITAAHCLKG